jgi:protein-S-isoprenylcysteine O-methyltransferase Ste14
MVVKLIVQTVVWLTSMGALLFIAAGTVKWPAGWFFLIEEGALGLAVGLWLARHDPALLAERLSPIIQRDQKRWDKMLIGLAIVAWNGWLALMALDAVRFGWSTMPFWWRVFGATLIFLSVFIAWLTFRENSYAAPVVKVQRDRGQRVISSGPYRYVRHPMYAGAILFFLGAPLLLGSLWGLALVPLLVAVLAVRAVNEERLLTTELDGYADYIARVRNRLVPLIW